MNSAIFNEAFKKLNLLEEEDFNLNRHDEIEEAEDFLDADVEDDALSIIDTEAETEEELQDNYIGDVILECEVCHSMIYKKPEEVDIDEETQTVNTQEECPYCMSMDGFKVIGQVSPYRESEFDVTVDGEDIDADGDIDEIEEVEIEEDDLDESCNGKDCEDKDVKNEAIRPGRKRKVRERVRESDEIRNDEFTENTSSGNKNDFEGSRKK